MKAIAHVQGGRSARPRDWRLRLAATCLASALASTAFASVEGTSLGNGPPILRHSTDLGPVAASEPMEITLWLKLRDEKGLDSVLAAQREHGAARLSSAQIDARYSPTAANVAAVSHFLSSRGFKITGVGPHNLFVRAAGTVDLVQSALHVELHQYRLRDMTFRASPTDAILPRELAPIVASVGGLSSLGAMPTVARVAGLKSQTNISRQTDAEGVRPRPLALGANPAGLIYSAQCLRPPTSVSFSGGGVSAHYTGNRYGADITNTAAGTVAPCGYQPSDLQKAYDMTPLYRAGLDGTGETIAIVDAYGSITIAQDAAAFSAFMGLPAPNLTIIGTPTESNYSTDANASWATETTLDVEWVHSIAPGAKIVLVVAPTNSFSDLFAGDATAASQPGVVSISNSWAGFEASLYPAFQLPVDNMFKLIGAQGESLQFASGDNGNNVSAIGFYDVSWPASSPYVTGVGGVSMAVNPDNGRIAFQSAWGTNLTEIAGPIALGSPPIDPPNNEGFIYGGGGGQSDVYPAPDFQRGLRSGRRLVPDISWLADPYTGVEVIYTGDPQGDLFIEVVGGTSLATPMFSALWSIATQRAGHPLGQAAPYLYNLPPGAITDVVGVDSGNDVTGNINDSNGNSSYSSWYLALPVQGVLSFYSALYNSPFSTSWFVIMFGTDSTLQAGSGYDTATGLGTPDGWNFVQAFGYRGW